MMADVRCTVVVPVFNEEESLGPLAQRLTSVLDSEGLDWQVLFVDDGSTDDSFGRIRDLHQADPRFTCIRFSRNFGAHVATSAGLEHARGDVAILTTADHEEPPEAIPELLKMWRDGYHIVWGIRARRSNKGLSRLGSKAYHLLFRWLAHMGPGQDEIGGGLFIADRIVLETVRKFPERNRNIIGLLLWAGFKQGRLVYEPAPRKFGRSKWTLAKKVKLAVDTFVGFSNRLLRLILLFGVLAVLLGVAALSYAVVDAVARGEFSTAAVVAAAAGAVALCAGLPCVSTGLLGEYVWRALDESRRRPLYVLQDRLGVEELGSQVHS